MPVIAYPIFDIPFIGTVRDELVQLEFLILVFLCIHLSFLGEPARVRCEYAVS